MQSLWAAQSREWDGNAYPAESKAQVLAAYSERVSLRSIERVFGAARQIVTPMPGDRSSP